VASRARVVLFKTLGAVMEALPTSWDIALGRGVARVVGPRTAAAAHLRENLRHAMSGPDGAVEPALLERCVRRGFAEYGQYWAESAKLPALSGAQISERFRLSEGREHLEAAKARGKGVVIALPHMGSWEWGGAYLAQIDLAMTAVAERLEPPELFEWFTSKREAIGLRVVPLDEHAGTVLLQTLRDNGVVGLLCDRDLQGNGVEVEFFGRRVTMPAGPATLALRTGATLVCASCYAGPGRDHHAVITRPLEAVRTGGLREDVTRVTQEIARVLEGLIQRAPEQWHVLEDRFGRA